MKFTKTHVANRGTATYKSAEGLVINIPKSVGEQPATLEIDGLTTPPAKAAKAAKVKMTPEERKAAAAERRAANASLTPAQKLEAAKANLAKRAAALAAKEAALAAPQASA